MPTNKHLTDLIINKVESQAVYDYMVENNLINDDELYLVEGESTAVLFTSQELTVPEKIQVLTNLGIVPENMEPDENGKIKVAKAETADVATSADKVAYKLTVGSKTYDGSAAVTIVKDDIGLGNVTNESKSTMFIDPVFTGTPIAPTAANTVNNTQIATTAFVHNVVNNLEDKDTTYTAGTGLSLAGTQFNHSNAIDAGTTSGSASENTITIPKITYDAQGHITKSETTSITLPVMTATEINDICGGTLETYLESIAAEGVGF